MNAPDVARHERNRFRKELPGFLDQQRLEFSGTAVWDWSYSGSKSDKKTRGEQEKTDIEATSAHNVRYRYPTARLQTQLAHQMTIAATWKAALKFVASLS